MSLSYASRLTQGVDYGVCGLPEKEDTSRVRTREMEKLVKLFEQSRYIVIHTGAGISTSCGIRDFRGPNGIWTREKRGLGFDLLPGDVPFEEASPSLTHMAIIALVQSGRCKHVVSQNVDGLHLRSGFPMEMLSELHGNIFQERCAVCKRVYFRNFDVGGCGFKKTERRCDAPCGGELYDMVLDWEDALPLKEFRLAKRHSLLADFSLALGTSMRVQPAAGIPLLTVNKVKLPKRTKRVEAQEAEDEEEGEEDAGDDALPAFTEEEQKLVRRNGSLAIVNLQPTPHDQSAAVRVHGKTDRIMRELMRRLEIGIPDFVRRETYELHLSVGGELRVATDPFGQNCLFAESVQVQILSHEESGAPPLLLQMFEFRPREVGHLELAQEHGVQIGNPVKVIARVRLNNNATLREVCIECVWAYQHCSVECKVDAEVVRKSFPLGDDDDNATFLERDLPRGQAAPKRSRKKREDDLEDGEGGEEEAEAPNEPQGDDGDQSKKKMIRRDDDAPQ